MPRFFSSFMNLDAEILRVLTLAGEKGLKTDKVARHVFNSCNSMFNPLNYKDVHAYVSQFLIKSAKSSSSVIVKGEGHGVYRIDFKMQYAQQLILKFAPHPAEGEDVDSETDTADLDMSLSLFD